MLIFSPNLTKLYCIQNKVRCSYKGVIACRFIKNRLKKGDVIFVTSDELLLLSLQSNSYSAAAVSCSADNAG